MTETGEKVRVPADQIQRTPTTMALASRGDALTPYLFAALRRHFSVIGQIDPELTRLQRLTIGALTFRPDRSRWVERFYKSGTARALRTSNAVRQLRHLPAAPDAVFQVHLLFDVPKVPAVIYVDCTHRQSAEHWPDWNPLRGKALQKWYRREQHSYDSADHLFAFSEPTRRSLMADYGISSDKVTVVGGGANLHALPAREPGPARTGGPPTILFIGNDFVRKGGYILLEAFDSVRQQVPEARLLLVGTLPPVEPRAGVEVLGRIHDRERIAQLYSEASVFALPSYFDPYPLVLLEAMSFGLPVVATRQTGVPEIVQDGESGRLVAPGDVEQLAAALLEVLEHPDQASQWGAAGRQRVEERFTWDSVVERMAPALARIANPAP